MGYKPMGYLEFEREYAKIFGTKNRTIVKEESGNGSSKLESKAATGAKHQGMSDVSR